MRPVSCHLETLGHRLGRTFWRLMVLGVILSVSTAVSADDAVKKSSKNTGDRSTAITSKGSEPTDVETKRPPLIEGDNTAGPKPDQASGSVLNTLISLGVATTIISVLILTVATVTLLRGRTPRTRLEEIEENLLKAIRVTDDNLSEQRHQVSLAIDNLATGIGAIPTEKRLRKLLEEFGRGSSGVSINEPENLKTRMAECERREGELNKRERQFGEDRRTLESERSDLRHKLAALDREREDYDEMLRRHEAQRRIWEQEKEAHLREVELQKTQAETKKSEADSLKKKADDALAEADSLKKKADDALAESLDREAKAEIARLKAESDRIAMAADLTLLQAIREYFWPVAFRDGGPLAAWRVQLEKKGTQSGSAAPLLINSLQRYNLLKSLAFGKDVDPEEMERAIQEVGRWAYAVWSEENLDDETKAETAETWARAIQAELGPKYKMRVARLGQPKDTSWMSYRPGGPSQVARVETWYIQGPNSILKAVVA